MQWSNAGSTFSASAHCSSEHPRMKCHLCASSRRTYRGASCNLNLCSTCSVIFPRSSVPLVAHSFGRCPVEQRSLVLLGKNRRSQIFDDYAAYLSFPILRQLLTLQEWRIAIDHSILILPLFFVCPHEFNFPLCCLISFCPNCRLPFFLYLVLLFHPLSLCTVAI